MSKPPAIALLSCATLWACGSSTSGLECGQGTIPERGKCVPAVSGSGGGSSAGAPGEVWLDPPGTEILLDDSEYIDPFTALVVDDSELYLSAMIGGGVYRMAKSGGVPEALASGESNPWGLAVTASSACWVEWVDGGGVRATSLSGGTATTLTATNIETIPYDAVADDDNVYYVTFERSSTSPEGTAGVFRVPLQGGEGVQLASLQPGAFRILQDEQNVYYLELGQLRSVAKADGSPLSLGAADVLGLKDAVAQDEAAVYLGGGDIVRVPKDGGASTVIASAPDFELSDLVVDETHVYFSNWQLGTIERVSKDGGTPQVFVGNAMNLQPKQFAVDVDFVYWIDGSEQSFGALKRAPKR